MISLKALSLNKVIFWGPDDYWILVEHGLVCNSNFDIPGLENWNLFTPFKSWRVFWLLQSIEYGRIDSMWLPRVGPQKIQLPAEQVLLECQAQNHLIFIFIPEGEFEGMCVSLCGMLCGCLIPALSSFSCMWYDHFCLALKFRSPVTTKRCLSALNKVSLAHSVFQRSNMVLPFLNNFFSYILNFLLGFTIPFFFFRNFSYM